MERERVERGEGQMRERGRRWKNTQERCWRKRNEGEGKMHFKGGKNEWKEKVR